MNRRSAKLESAKCGDWYVANTNRHLAVMLNFRIWITVALICLSFYLGACRDPLLQSRWTGSPPLIDGQVTEWQAAPAHKLESWPASLKLMNDAGFLYLLLSFDDPMMARHIRNAGIKLEFGEQDNKDPVLTLSYSGLDSLYWQSGFEDSFWDFLNTVQKNRIEERQKILRSMITIGQGGQKIRVPADGEQGPAAARITGKDSTVYEFKIPLQVDKGNLYAIHADPGKRVDVTISLADQSHENLPPGITGRRSNRVPQTESVIRLQILLAAAKEQE
jgi:hypothetical protein